MKWEPVIGLEVHAQLKTKSKIFSGSSTAYGAEPNTQANIVDLALPGTLPVLNSKVVDMAIKFGLAVNGQIAPITHFARKNYFYPDLPKGYQISQFEHPIISGGSLNFNINGQSKTVNLVRAHLEEDAGKSIHDLFDDYTAIDLNRAGIPLLEIVSEPEMYSADEAIAFLKTLHNIVKYLDICDGNMQEGSFRIDVNVSMRPKGSDKLGTRTEIKNINSFKFVEQAIYHEIERQIEVLNSGGIITQVTLLYDAQNNVTKPMRSKEEANDYRYFLEPDLPPLVIPKELIASIAKKMPELPQQKFERFQQEFGLNEYDANILIANKELANYFEQTAKLSSASKKLVANWIIGELLSYLNKHNQTLTECVLSPAMLAELLDNISDQTINNKIAKTIFEQMWLTGVSANTIIEKQQLSQMTNENELLQVIDNILKKFPEQLSEYKAGKEKLFGFFVGEVMKITKGRANPQKINSLLQNKLTKE